MPVHRDALARVLTDERAVLTAEGDRLAYDALVVALGARPVEAVPGALTFRGRQDAGRVRELVRLAGERRARELAFVVPAGTTWSLPLYELALQAAAAVRGAARIMLVTPEPAPLAAFGERASVAVAAVLAERGVELLRGDRGREVAGGVLLTDAGELPADAVVALARLTGPHLPRPALRPARASCRSTSTGPCSTGRVFAVGDVAAAGPKQGGLAHSRRMRRRPRSRRGRPASPSRGSRPPSSAARWSRAPARSTSAASAAAASEASWEPLWWPPAKLAARHLSHHLAAHLTAA